MDPRDPSHILDLYTTSLLFPNFFPKHLQLLVLSTSTRVGLNAIRLNSDPTEITVRLFGKSVAFAIFHLFGRNGKDSLRIMKLCTAFRKISKINDAYDAPSSINYIYTNCL